MSKSTPLLVGPARVPIETLRPHPKNPRRGNAEDLAASIRRFGQTKPILAQSSTARILAGHRTWEGAKLAGLTEVDIVAIDISDEEALAYVLADNRTSDLGRYEDAAVLKLLEGLADLSGTGYAPDDVDDLLTRLNALEPVRPVVGAVDYAETDAEFAARGLADPEGAGPMQKEVLLMLIESDAAAFDAAVAKLSEAWKISGQADVVFEALRRDAEAIA